MTTTDHTGRAALAADHLLCHPDAVAIVTALHATVPVALRNQLDAAAEQIHTGMSTAVAAGVVDGHHFTPGTIPAWLRLGVLTALAEWFACAGSTCMHSPHPARPQPVAAAAWKPGLVVCGRCVHLLNPRNRDADRTCDSCGHLTTGPQHNDGIWPGLIVVGPLTYSFGVCRDCRCWSASPTTKGSP